MASRFVDAIYIAPVWNSVGCEVIGELSSNGEIGFVRFHAKSIKHTIHLTWSTKFYQDLHQLVVREHEHGSVSEPPPQVLPAANPSLRCHKSGPPVDWGQGRRWVHGQLHRLQGPQGAGDKKRTCALSCMLQKI